MSLVETLGYHPRQANVIQRASWLISQSRPGAWFFSKTVHRVDRLLLRVTRGRLSVPGLLTGLPVITLVTIGAKSGDRRESPLLGVPIGDRIAIIGTNFGQRSTPSWWFNLRANPDVEVVYRGTHARARAHEVEGTERAAIWDTARGIYAGYEAYARRITDRPIHVAVLEQPAREDPARSAP